MTRWLLGPDGYFPAGWGAIGDVPGGAMVGTVAFQVTATGTLTGALVVDDLTLPGFGPIKWKAPRRNAPRERRVLAAALAGRAVIAVQASGTLSALALASGEAKFSVSAKGTGEASPWVTDEELAAMLLALGIEPGEEVEITFAAPHAPTDDDDSEMLAVVLALLEAA